MHIVCLDAPAPPDYGGAIDMFYKIKALAGTGKKITLHYFNYNDQRSTSGLENFCENIYAYKRKNPIASLPLTQPYIIRSRINRALNDRLNKDGYPVLLEGLHCSGILPHLNDPSRAVIRMHNEEASYYHHLAQTESSLLKRMYFQQEAKLLYRYQKEMPKEVKLACLSETDRQLFKNEYGFTNTFFIPCFIPWQTLSIQKGIGTYCLYHGNMAVSENEEAAFWLIHHVFSKLTIPLVIAGKNITDRLKQKAKNHSHIRMVNQPSIEEINALVRNAQMNVLPSMNATGVKLKLLNALLNGRHCITNNNGIAGSRIKGSVIVEETSAAWLSAIGRLMGKEFSNEDVEKRRAILSLYNNTINARKLSALW